MIVVEYEKVINQPVEKIFDRLVDIDDYPYTPKYRRQGIATEAVKLLTGYLFDRKKHDRIRLIIYPENAASKRVAEKCGYQMEGVAHGAWYHRGENVDVEVYALLEEEFEGVGYR